MNTLIHFNTYEEFEAELARQLGLEMSLEQLRQVTGNGVRNVVATRATAPARDFESGYAACTNAAQRHAFVRANKAEARQYLARNRDKAVPSTRRTAK